MEHILLIDFAARLIEGVDFVKIASGGAGPHEEIDQFAHAKGIDTVDLN